jgi:hypothetical protein
LINYLSFKNYSYTIAIDGKTYNPFKSEPENFTNKDTFTVRNKTFIPTVDISKEYLPLFKSKPLLKEITKIKLSKSMMNFNYIPIQNITLKPL